MSGAPATPNNFIIQQANQQVLVSWSLSTGATSYVINRSLDNITFTLLTTISGSPLATSFIDTTVSIGVQYWYQVSAVNASGASNFTNSASSIPTPSGEMSLAQIRLSAQQRADLVNAGFITTSEWNQYINQAMYELYDLLVTMYEDYFVATPIQFVTNGNVFLYPLPNGSNTFLSGVNTSVTFTPPAFYKLLGVDLAIQNTNNGYVTVNKFNFISRNRYIYPNSASTIYGVFNMQYRVMGNNIEFIPTPSANQAVRIWYIPRLTALLSDTDITTIGFSGWLEYVIVRAAKYALDKEETDSTRLNEELLFLQKRITESASNRDVGQPDTISDTRSNSGDGWGAGFGPGSSGGW